MRILFSLNSKTLASQQQDLFLEKKQLILDTPEHGLHNLLETWPLWQEDQTINLRLWIDVLNKLDIILRRCLKSFKKVLIAPKVCRKDHPVYIANPYDQDFELFETILIWTGQLLRRSVNKDVYNSTEVVIECLWSYDDRLALSALALLEALALPPHNHRNIYVFEHSTSLHKDLYSCLPMFDILDGVMSAFRSSVDDILLNLRRSSKGLELTPSQKQLDTHFTSRLSYVTEARTKAQITAEFSGGYTVRKEITIDDVVSDPRTVQEIMGMSHSLGVRHEHRLALLWRIRMQRQLANAISKGPDCIDDVWGVFRVMLRAAIIVLYCVPRDNMLSIFFQGKLALAEEALNIVSSVATRVGSSYKRAQASTGVSVHAHGTRDGTLATESGKLNRVLFSEEGVAPSVFSSTPTTATSTTATSTTQGKSFTSEFSEDIPHDVRMLACRCLQALSSRHEESNRQLGAREIVVMTIIDPFCDLQAKMGLNRRLQGVPLYSVVGDNDSSGLITTLLKRELNFLARVAGAVTTAVETVGSATVGASEVVPANSSPEEVLLLSLGGYTTAAQLEQRLLWIEMLLMTVMTSLVLNGAIAALIDNNAVGLALSFVSASIVNKDPPGTDVSSGSTRNDKLKLWSRSRSYMWVSLESFTAQLLEMLFSRRSAYEQFVAQDGKALVMQRLWQEVDTIEAEGLGDIPQHQQSVVLSYVSILTVCLDEGEDMHTTGDAPKNAEIVRSEPFRDLVQAVLRVVGSKSSPVLSAVLCLIKDFIQNDMAPPRVADHFLAADVGIIKSAWTAASLPLIFHDDDTLKSMLDFVDSVALSVDGMRLIQAINPFKVIFNVFHDHRYLLSESSILLSEVPSEIGEKVEEYLRHYPESMGMCFGAILAEIGHICDQLDENMAAQSKLTIFNDDFDVFSHFYDYSVDQGEFAWVQCLMSALLCLSSMLSHKKKCMDKLVELKGIPLLLRALKHAFGSPIYVITSMTGQFPGFQNVIQCLREILDMVCRSHWQNVLDELEKELKSGLATVARQTATYIRGEPFPPSASAASVPEDDEGLPRVSFSGFLGSLETFPARSSKYFDFGVILRNILIVGYLVDAAQLALKGIISHAKRFTDTEAKFLFGADKELIKEPAKQPFAASPSDSKSVVYDTASKATLNSKDSMANTTTVGGGGGEGSKKRFVLPIAKVELGQKKGAKAKASSTKSGKKGGRGKADSAADRGVINRILALVGSELCNECILELSRFRATAWPTSSERLEYKLLVLTDDTKVKNGIGTTRPTRVSLLESACTVEACQMIRVERHMLNKPEVTDMYYRLKGSVQPLGVRDSEPIADADTDPDPDADANADQDVEADMKPDYGWVKCFDKEGLPQIAVLGIRRAAEPAEAAEPKTADCAKQGQVGSQETEQQAGGVRSSDQAGCRVLGVDFSVTVTAGLSGSFTLRCLADTLSCFYGTVVTAFRQIEVLAKDIDYLVPSVLRMCTALCRGVKEKPLHLVTVEDLSKAVRGLYIISMTLFSESKVSAFTRAHLVYLDGGAVMETLFSTLASILSLCLPGVAGDFIVQEASLTHASHLINNVLRHILTDTQPIEAIRSGWRAQEAEDLLKSVDSSYDTWTTKARLCGSACTFLEPLWAQPLLYQLPMLVIDELFETMRLCASAVRGLLEDRPNCNAVSSSEGAMDVSDAAVVAAAATAAVVAAVAECKYSAAMIANAAGSSLATTLPPSADNELDFTTTATDATLPPPPTWAMLSLHTADSSPRVVHAPLASAAKGRILTGLLSPQALAMSSLPNILLGLNRSAGEVDVLSHAHLSAHLDLKMSELCTAVSRISAVLMETPIDESFAYYRTRHPLSNIMDIFKPAYLNHINREEEARKILFVTWIPIFIQWFNVQHRNSTCRSDAQAHVFARLCVLIPLLKRVQCLLCASADVHDVSANKRLAGMLDAILCILDGEPGSNKSSEPNGNHTLLLLLLSYSPRLGDIVVSLVKALERWSISVVDGGKKGTENWKRWSTKLRSEFTDAANQIDVEAAVPAMLLLDIMSTTLFVSPKLAEVFKAVISSPFLVELLGSAALGSIPVSEISDNLDQCTDGSIPYFSKTCVTPGLKHQLVPVCLAVIQNLGGLCEGASLSRPNRSARIKRLIERSTMHTEAQKMKMWWVESDVTIKEELLQCSLQLVCSIVSTVDDSKSAFLALHGTEIVLNSQTRFAGIGMLIAELLSIVYDTHTELQQRMRDALVKVLREEVKSERQSPRKSYKKKSDEDVVAKAYKEFIKHDCRPFAPLIRRDPTTFFETISAPETCEDLFQVALNAKYVCSEGELQQAAGGSGSDSGSGFDNGITAQGSGTQTVGVNVRDHMRSLADTIIGSMLQLRRERGVATQPISVTWSDAASTRAADLLIVAAELPHLLAPESAKHLVDLLISPQRHIHSNVTEVASAKVDDSSSSPPFLLIDFLLKGIVLATDPESATIVRKQEAQAATYLLASLTSLRCRGVGYCYRLPVVRCIVSIVQEIDERIAAAPSASPTDADALQASVYALSTFLHMLVLFPKDWTAVSRKVFDFRAPELFAGLAVVGLQHPLLRCIRFCASRVAVSQAARVSLSRLAIAVTAIVRVGLPIVEKLSNRGDENKLKSISEDMSVLALIGGRCGAEGFDFSAEWDPDPADQIEEDTSDKFDFLRQNDIIGEEKKEEEDVTEMSTAASGCGFVSAGQDSLQPWACLVCTMMNSSFLPFCEVCNAARGETSWHVPVIPSAGLTLSSAPDHAVVDAVSGSTVKETVCVSTWSCDACTLINDGAADVCEMCNALRPPGATVELTSVNSEIPFSAIDVDKILEELNSPTSTSIASPTLVPAEADSVAVSAVDTLSDTGVDKEVGEYFWSCGVCTFINDGTADVCDMCTAPRPSTATSTATAGNSSGVATSAAATTETADGAKSTHVNTEADIHEFEGGEDWEDVVEEEEEGNWEDVDEEDEDEGERGDNSDVAKVDDPCKEMESAAITQAVDGESAIDADGVHEGAEEGEDEEVWEDDDGDDENDSGDHGDGDVEDDCDDIDDTEEVEEEDDEDVEVAAAAVATRRARVTYRGTRRQSFRAARRSSAVVYDDENDDDDGRYGSEASEHSIDSVDSDEEEDEGGEENECDFSVEEEEEECGEDDSEGEGGSSNDEDDEDNDEDDEENEGDEDEEGDEMFLEDDDDDDDQETNPDEEKLDFGSHDIPQFAAWRPSLDTLQSSWLARESGELKQEAALQQEDSTPSPLAVAVHRHPLLSIGVGIEKKLIPRWGRSSQLFLGEWQDSAEELIFRYGPQFSPRMWAGTAKALTLHLSYDSFTSALKKVVDELLERHKKRVHTIATGHAAEGRAVVTNDSRPPHESPEVLSSSTAGTSSQIDTESSPLVVFTPATTHLHLHQEILPLALQTIVAFDRNSDARDDRHVDSLLWLIELTMHPVHNAAAIEGTLRMYIACVLQENRASEAALRSMCSVPTGSPSSAVDSTAAGSAANSAAGSTASFATPVDGEEVKENSLLCIMRSFLRVLFRLHYGNKAALLSLPYNDADISVVAGSTMRENLFNAFMRTLALPCTQREGCMEALIDMAATLCFVMVDTESNLTVKQREQLVNCNEFGVQTEEKARLVSTNPENTPSLLPSGLHALLSIYLGPFWCNEFVTERLEKVLMFVSHRRATWRQLMRVGRALVWKLLAEVEKDFGEVHAAIATAAPPGATLGATDPISLLSPPTTPAIDFSTRSSAHSGGEDAPASIQAVAEAHLHSPESVMRLLAVTRVLLRCTDTMRTAQPLIPSTDTHPFLATGAAPRHVSSDNSSGSIGFISGDGETVASTEAAAPPTSAAAVTASATTAVSKRRSSLDSGARLGAEVEASRQLGKTFAQVVRSSVWQQLDECLFLVTQTRLTDVSMGPLDGTVGSVTSSQTRSASSVTVGGTAATITTAGGSTAGTSRAATDGSEKKDDDSSVSISSAARRALPMVECFIATVGACTIQFPEIPRRCSLMSLKQQLEELRSQTKLMGDAMTPLTDAISSTTALMTVVNENVVRATTVVALGTSDGNQAALDGLASAGKQFKEIESIRESYSRQLSESKLQLSTLQATAASLSDSLKTRPEDSRLAASIRSSLQETTAAMNIQEELLTRCLKTFADVESPLESMRVTARLLSAAMGASCSPEIAAQLGSPSLLGSSSPLGSSSLLGSSLPLAAESPALVSQESTIPSAGVVSPGLGPADKGDVDSREADGLAAMSGDHSDSDCDDSVEASPPSRLNREFSMPGTRFREMSAVKSGTPAAYRFDLTANIAALAMDEDDGDDDDGDDGATTAVQPLGTMFGGAAPVLPTAVSAGPHVVQSNVRLMSPRYAATSPRHRASSPRAVLRLEHPVSISHADGIAELPIGFRLIDFVERYQPLVNALLKQNVRLLESSLLPVQLIPECRKCIDFSVKRKLLRLKIRRIQRRVDPDDEHTVNFATFLADADRRLVEQERRSERRVLNNDGGDDDDDEGEDDDDDDYSISVEVSRENIMQASFEAFRSMRPRHLLRGKLNIEFEDEEGIDAGGLTREWLTLLMREVFKPDYALFLVCGDGNTYQPNPQSGLNSEHLEYFKFIGRIVGKAIIEGHLLDVHFSRPFYKHMLGLPVSFHDLEGLDPEYFKSLKTMLEYPLVDLGLDGSYTFSAELRQFGNVETEDLVEGGRDIVVTDENKGEYARYIAHHRLTASFRKQIDSFLEGFHELVPSDAISIFDAQELELLISGLPEIDIDDLRRHTTYEGYRTTDDTIRALWKVLESFSKEERALFVQFHRLPCLHVVQFVTGTSKVPLEGFGALQGSEGRQLFNVHRSYVDTQQLPTAHTCFNQLDLPNYANEVDLKAKLLLAIREGSEGFGFA